MESRETTETEVTCTEGTTNPSIPLAVSTQCKVCKIDFTESTILKHITFKNLANLIILQKKSNYFDNGQGNVKTIRGAAN